MYCVGFRVKVSVKDMEKIHARLGSRINKGFPPAFAQPIRKALDDAVKNKKMTKEDVPGWIRDINKMYAAGHIPKGEEDSFIREIGLYAEGPAPSMPTPRMQELMNEYNLAKSSLKPGQKLKWSAKSYEGELARPMPEWLIYWRSGFRQDKGAYRLRRNFYGDSQERYSREEMNEKIDKAFAALRRDDGTPIPEIRSSSWARWFKGDNDRLAWPKPVQDLFLEKFVTKEYIDQPSPREEFAKIDPFNGYEIGFTPRMWTMEFDHLSKLRNGKVYNLPETLPPTREQGGVKGLS